MKPPAPRRSTVWDRLGASQGAAGGYDLAANVLVGLGLGWAAQRWLGTPQPWGLVGGIVLGSVSGFYQLFRGQASGVQRPAGPGRGRKEDGPHA